MTAAPSEPARGLSAQELALVAQELAVHLAGARVLDATPLHGVDDLLVVLQVGEARERLHVALGQARARVVTTSRRFAREELAAGPRADLLRRHLEGAAVEAVEQPAGERRLALRLRKDGKRLCLWVELFSARGLWALVDGDDVVLDLSRPVATAVRTLDRGGRYAPPPPRSPDAANPLARSTSGGAAPRFALPVLAAIDAHFQAQDQVGEIAAQRQALHLAADRAATRAKQKADGVKEQLEAGARSGELRAEADLMLAYLHTVARGADHMTVPDPEGGERTIALDPSRPVQVQAQARYERARRLDDGRVIAEGRLQEADALLAALLPLQQELAGAAALDGARLEELQAQLQQLGALPKKKASEAPHPRGPKAANKANKANRRVAGENLRRFASAEGYDILVGRDNQQNDRLTLRIANGNDVWLHVGGGRAGSHVVVRLPKGKTASLDTLLDAGTLAVHFSKARGERTIDVIYTAAKHVRKPKGLPPGAVVPSHTKSLTVRLDEARLRRLLDSSAEPSD